MEPAQPQPQSNRSGRPDLDLMVEPLAGHGRIHGAGVHIRAASQRAHAVQPIAQLLPPLMFE